VRIFAPPHQLALGLHGVLDLVRDAAKPVYRRIVAWAQSLKELKVELRKAKERLRHKRDVILGCIRQPGFEV
jgi:hypothetical protein